mmetsp:Transcript_19361/g.29867  ORF Transcript_19361/g.29867 Transcript_19361/m.29867 type:complete len:99 (+) Transcript_19361:264-560(+)
MAVGLVVAQAALVAAEKVQAVVPVTTEVAAIIKTDTARHQIAVPATTPQIRKTTSSGSNSSSSTSNCIICNSTDHILYQCPYCTNAQTDMRQGTKTER